MLSFQKNEPSVNVPRFSKIPASYQVALRKNKKTNSSGLFGARSRFLSLLLLFWTAGLLLPADSLEAKTLKEVDPRWSRIFPDTLAAKATLSPVIRELPPPAGPREVQLSGRRAVVSPNIRMHPSSTTSQSEMSVITHPLNPDEVLAGANAAHISISALSQGWYHTTDGGASWGGGDTLPTHTNLSLYMSDPAVGINLDGDLFLNAILYGGTSDIVVARSTDQGTTWSQTAVPSATNGEDKNHLAVDVNPSSPFEGYLYTGYTDFDFSPGAFRFSRSTDAGVSFSSPISISGSVGSQFAQGANLAVGPNGELYATWSGYDVFPPVTTHLGFNKSTDGGVTWQGAMSIRNVFDIRGQLNKGGNFVRVSSFPSMAVDRSGGSRDGWIYIIYAEKNPTTPDIFLVRSSDGGATWSAPHKVNQDVSGKDQWFSWVSVDPATGHLYVVYYDSRNFPANDSAQVYISSSIDGGDTFEDLLVSDVAFLPTPIPGLAGGYMGDYIGISALNGVVWPCWNDNRTGIHQAYTSRIVFVEVGSPPKISISPDSLDFGGVYLGYPETLSVSVRNLGFPETLQVSNIVSDNPGFTPETTALVLPGGSVRKLKVAFNPFATGPVTATLTITSNDTANPTVTVALKGTAVYPPALAVSPDSFAFTLNEGDSATATLIIENAGLGTLNFSVAHSFQHPALSLTAKNGIINFEVQPYLRSENNYSSNAGVSDLPAPAAALLRPLMNSAVDSSIRILLVEFGDPTYALLDSLGLAYRRVFPNDFDTVNLNNYDLLLVGSAFSSFDLQHLVNRQPDIAAFINSGGGVVALTEGGADNAWQWLPVPVTGAPFDGNNVHITDPAHPVMDSLTDADLSNWSNSYHNAFSSFSASLNVLALAVEPGNVPLVLAGQYGAGRIVITGLHNEHYSFGGFLGALRMAGNMIRWAGTVNWLSENPTTGTVPPGNSAEIEVKVKTDQLDGGRFRANILISSNDPGNPQDTVPVALHIIGAPNIVLSDDTLDFGDAYVNFPDTLTLRVSNNGSDLLEVTGMTVDNPRFSVLDSTVFNVPQNQFRDVRVQFLPTAVGPETAELSIASTDSTDSVVAVQLVGNGILPPDISVSPDSLEADLFTGEVKVETLTIANTGYSDLTFDITNEAAAIQALKGPNGLPAIRWNSIAAGNLTDLPPTTASSQHSEAPESISRPLVPADFLIIDHFKDKTFFGGYSSVLASEFDLNTLTVADLKQYEVVYCEPDWSSYANLTNNMSKISAYVQSGGVMVLNVGGNIGDGLGIDPLGTNYANYAGGFGGQTHQSETIADPAHPYITGQLYGGALLTTADFNSWGATDHGHLFNYPGSSHIVLNNTQNASWLEYPLGGGKVIVTTLTYGWGGSGARGNPLANLINYAFHLSQSSWLSLNPTSGTVPAGSSLNVEVTFDATGLNGGDYFANLLVSSNDPDEPVDTTPVHLHVTGAPDIELSDDSLDFGTPFVGASVVETLVVSNVGTDSLGGNISSDNPDYTVSPSSFSLDPGENQVVLVTFTPPDSGVSNGNLTITSNDPDEPSLAVYLQGRGLLPPDIAVSPDSLADSLFTGEMSVETLTIANNGYSNLTFDVLIEGTSLSALPVRINPIVRSRPGDLGTLSAVKNEKIPNPYSDLEKVKEESALKRLTNSPSALIRKPASAAGGRLFGAGRSQISEVDLNTGISINSFPTPVSTSDGPTALAFSGNQLFFTDAFTTPNIYVLDPNSGAVMNTFPAPSSFIDGLAFVDGKLYAQDYNSDVIFELNSDNGTVLRTITPPVVIGGGIDGGNGRLFASNFASAIYELSLADGSVINSFVPLNTVYGLGLAAGRLFATVPGGGIDEYDANTGAFLGSISSLSFAALAGGGVAWLSESPTSGTVPAGSSMNVEVTFNATGLNVGDYFANILVSSNDPDESVDTTPVHLHVTGIPNIVLSKDTLDFGSVFISYPDTLSLTVSNNGSDVLEVSGISSNNPRFSVIDPFIFNVPPGDSQRVRVQFLPLAVGPDSGVLSVASTDSTDPVVYVRLLGNGIYPPVMEVSPDSFAFELRKGDSASSHLLINNSGLGTLQFHLQVETQPVFNVETRPVHQILSGDSSTSQPEKIFRWDWRRASERPISSGHSVQLPTFTSGILLPVIVTDSVGDGGATDIREIAGEIAADHIGFQFVFATLLNPSNFGGVLGLDIDQNSQTGDPLPIGIPQNDVGCEYFASFYSLASNRVDLFNSEGNLVGSFPASVDAHSFSFALPLSALDNDDGRLNLAAAVGDASGYPTDWIPDTGHGVLQLNWLTLNPYEGTLLAGESLAVEVKVKTDPLSLDSFQAKIRIVSNDPANLLRAVPVSLTVTCTAAKGDMNGDSLLTATDVVLNINCVFLNTGTCSLCFADLNCDGRLSPGDIVLELRAVFLHTPLPCL